MGQRIFARAGVIQTMGGAVVGRYAVPNEGNNRVRNIVRSKRTDLWSAGIVLTKEEVFKKAKHQSSPTERETPSTG